MKRIVIVSIASLMWGYGQSGSPASAAEAPADITVVRDAISRRLTAVGEVKARVAEYYANTGAFPATCAAIKSVCPEYIGVNDEGVIAIDLGSTGLAELAGTAIYLRATVTEFGEIIWKCSSNGPPQYVPRSCLGK